MSATTQVPAAATTGAGDTEHAGVVALEAGRSGKVPGWFLILWRNNKCRIGIVMHNIHLCLRWSWFVSVKRRARTKNRLACAVA